MASTSLCGFRSLIPRLSLTDLNLPFFPSRTQDNNDGLNFSLPVLQPAKGEQWAPPRTAASVEVRLGGGCCVAALAVAALVRFGGWVGPLSSAPGAQGRSPTGRSPAQGATAVDASLVCVCASCSCRRWTMRAASCTSSSCRAAPAATGRARRHGKESMGVWGRHAQPRQMAKP